MSRRRLWVGDVVHVAWRGVVAVVREDPALEGRLVGVRRKDHVVVHRIWSYGTGTGVERRVATRCSREMAADGVEFVWMGDLGPLLRPCRKCWSRLGLEAARRELEWARAAYRQGDGGDVASGGVER